jgi:hypothetical protein
MLMQSKIKLDHKTKMEASKIKQTPNETATDAKAKQMLMQQN